MSADFFSPRCAGVLLHPTSLPGRHGNGDLGAEAFRFVDTLDAAGMSVWQVLPHGPTHDDGSPYQCLSAHAGNPDWISLEKLVESGWLEQNSVNTCAQTSNRLECLRQAAVGFKNANDSQQQASFSKFKRENTDWLDDYALFTVLRGHFLSQSWTAWPHALREREPRALTKMRQDFQAQIEQVCFEQFIFFSQWQVLRRYANAHGIRLLGDMPFYVAHDSSDVWAHPELFELDVNGQPLEVAGVPPDYFSATGQRWGNPLFDWEIMARDDYGWWSTRLRTALNLYDMVRIDHFRGMEAYWSIPASEPTAMGGRWRKGPAESLLKALVKNLGSLPVVAEDLGVITPEVTALREKFGLPGMKILQFAFDSGPENPYLPHQHTTDSVVYTGTHDNDTTLGWFHSLTNEQRHHVREYLGLPAEEMPWPLLRAAWASIGNMAIVPLQDLLALDGTHRMNTPGTTAGNWRWRFEWDWVPGELTGRVRHLLEIYGRLLAR